MKCIAKYKNGLVIDSVTRDYEVSMDAAPPLGTKEGMTPGELFLNSLAGCKIMSLMTLARKNKIDIEDITLEIVGEAGLISPDDIGKEFKKIDSTYNIVSSHPRSTIEELIKDADKICTVGNSLNSNIEKTYKINLK